MSLLTNQITERVLFTTVVIGIILILFGLVRIADITMKLNNNLAHQIQTSGEEVNVESTAQGRSLVYSDIERRRLSKERGEMYFVTGAGLVLLGIGWASFEILNDRRRRTQEDTQANSSLAET